MSEFSDAVELVLKNEGGLVENPNDPGGITNYGISLRLLKSLDPKKYNFLGETINSDDIKHLTIEQAKTIYFNEFWCASRFQELTNQILCNQVFDAAVNMGIAPAIKILQRALWSATLHKCVIDDGILGNNTIFYANRQSDNQIGVVELLAAFRSERAGDYRILALHYPTEVLFLNGWLARAYGFTL